MSTRLIEVQARMISLRERILLEGNPVSNENSKGLRESMHQYIDPEFPYGGMGIFEFPNGFLFVDGSDPGDVSASMYLKEDLPNDMKVEALWTFLQETEPEEFEYIIIDGDPSNPVRRQLLRYKESFKEMGASKADVDSIAHYIQEEVWGGEEEEEDW